MPFPNDEIVTKSIPSFLAPLVRPLTLDPQAPSEPNGYVSDKSPKSAVFPLLSTVAYSITFKLAGFVLPPNTMRRVPVPKFHESPPFDDTKSPPRY